MSTPTPAAPAEPTWPGAPARGRAWRRALGWGAAAAVVAAAAFGWQQYAGRKPAPTFVKAEIERGDVVAKVTATGTLAASKTVDVSSQISGRVQQLFVDFNAPVRKGQVLAKLDPQLLVAAREQAQANLASARAAVRRARAQAAVADRNWRRNAELARQDFIAAAELDAARTEADVARAQVTSAEAALAQAVAQERQAGVNLSYASIPSPIDGVVIARNVDVGQTVAASLQAPTLFVLAQDLKKLEVHANVAEADVGRLKPGMPVEFTVDAFPGEPFEGTVRQIRNAPQNVQNVVTYVAIVDVANPELKLRIGMTANVAFVVDEAIDVVRVPNAALRFRPSEAAYQREKRKDASPAPGASAAPEGEGRAGEGREGRGGEARGGEGWGRGRGRGPRVWVEEAPGQLRPVRLETGLTDGTYTEVVEGDLDEGDQVITDEVGATPPSARPGRGGGGRRMPRF